jgi:hypothetical protein
MSSCGILLISLWLLVLVLPATAGEPDVTPERIMASQQCLHLMGYYHGPINGVIHPAQRWALLHFAKDRWGEAYESISVEEITRRFWDDCLRAAKAERAKLDKELAELRAQRQRRDAIRSR